MLTPGSEQSEIVSYLEQDDEISDLIKMYIFSGLVTIRF
jgi:hypothetical protein